MENQKGHRAFQGSVSVRILSVPKKAIFRSFVFFLKLRLKKSLKRPIGCAFTRIRSKLTFIDGLSDWIRTSGLYHPKVARYHLRHTQITAVPDSLIIIAGRNRNFKAFCRKNHIVLDFIREAGKQHASGISKRSAPGRISTVGLTVGTFSPSRLRSSG